MEDIFKKAAEEYPLKTNTANWESVSEKLRSLERGTNRIKISFGISKVKAGLFFAFLLIPLSLAITKYYFENDKALNAATTSKEEKKSLNVNGEQVAKTRSTKEFKIQKSDNLIFTANIPDISNQTIMISPQLAPLKNNYNSGLYVIKALPNTVCNGTIKNTLTPNNSLLPASGNYSNEATSNNKEQSKSVTEHTSEEKNIPAVKAKKPNIKKTKHFYLGIVGAPELTSIKFQPTRRSVNAGAIIGYSINSKLNIELGIVLAKKYYYTNGKYIEPNSIRHDNAEILNAYANSSITELPLTVQYNFKKESNSRIFASVGSVSYVIHKEHYDYTYIKNGREKQSSRNFKKASNDLFSNVQLSAGYEHSILNKAGSIRIEPYCRIPVGGIGASNLPVTSVGINIALTKYIK